MAWFSNSTYSVLWDVIAHLCSNINSGLQLWNVWVIMQGSFMWTKLLTQSLNSTLKINWEQDYGKFPNITGVSTWKIKQSISQHWYVQIRVVTINIFDKTIVYNWNKFSIKGLTHLIGLLFPNWIISEIVVDVQFRSLLRTVANHMNFIPLSKRSNQCSKSHFINCASQTGRLQYFARCCAATAAHGWLHSLGMSISNTMYRLET